MVAVIPLMTIVVIVVGVAVCNINLGSTLAPKATVLQNLSAAAAGCTTVELIWLTGFVHTHSNAPTTNDANTKNVSRPQRITSTRCDLRLAK
jgi:hypothetical protein